MKAITLEELLEAGCHFGHQVTRQNPKARDFVFEARDNIHIIDLAKTKEGLEEAADFVKDLASKEGSTMVIVGSKRQAAPIILKEVKNAHQALQSKQIPAGLFTVTNRWIGGTFTNAVEVQKNYKKLHDIEARLKDDFEKARYTKKEIGMWEKEKVKLENFYGGVSQMQKLPDALFVVDSHLEHLAVMEARRMGVPTVGIVDTNADPNVIDYVIPANDDAVGSIELLVKYIVDAWVEGKEKPQPKPSVASSKAKAKDDKKAMDGKKVSKKPSSAKATEGQGK